MAGGEETAIPFLIRQISMEKDLPYKIALSLAPGVGSVIYRRLVQAFGTPELALRASFQELNRVEGVGPKVAMAIKKFNWPPLVEKELNFAQKIGVRIISWDNPEYPAQLKQIYDPPPVLYLRGQFLKQDEKAIAVVGSRNPTTYGQTAAERIAMGLSRAGVTVISGLARGVDSCAHRGAIRAGGRTIGVLGCGLDIVYPPESKELYEQVAKQGVLISEFPLGTPPDSDHFPIRNRIISGLSLGVAVVEATLRSGSLITARFALDQGREVFAVPGNVDSPRSEGTNRLIKEGAKLVIRAEDILEEISPLAKFCAPLEKPLEPPLSAEEKKVFSVLTSHPLHIDQISAQTKLSSAQALTILLSLELAGQVKQLPGMNFKRA